LIEGPLTGADGARSAASTILAERRFHAPPLPRPLHGLLHAIGTAIKEPGRWVVDGVNQIGKLFPGGAAVVWILLGLALLATSVLVARRYSRRALIGGSDESELDPGRPLQQAAELERDADQAEREGKLAEAVRLRFEAGLARLAERGAIAPPRSTPTGELAGALQSPAFDGLAHRFDEIAYGAAPAQAADVMQARRQWPVVLREARRG
jgi:hypothetical protein